MYRVHVRRHFDSAHALRGYNGKCENVHGHRWEIVVCAQREDLDDIGLSVDFTLLKEKLDTILSSFDHRNLNETAPFDQINPSSENIARTVYNRLLDALPGCDLAYVEAWESPDAWVTYSDT